MTRIISEESNKNLKREYRLRFFTVLFFVVSFVLFINISLISSSYVLVSSYEKIYTSSDAHAFNEQAMQVRKELDTKISQTSALSKKVPRDSQGINTQVVPMLLDYSGNTIELNSIEIIQEEPVAKITIRGVSMTRDALLEFQNKIKEDVRFVDFNVPIDTLTKQRDISFSVTFTYNEN